MGDKRSKAIDAAVEEAVKGKPSSPAPAEKTPWEKAGMSYAEWSRGMDQRRKEIEDHGMQSEDEVQNHHIQRR